MSRPSAKTGHWKAPEALSATEAGHLQVALTVVSVLLVLSVLTCVRLWLHSVSEISEVVVPIGGDLVPTTPIETALDSTLSHLQPGRVVTDVPREMKVAEAKRVTIRVSRDLKADITRGLRNAGVPNVEELEKVSPRMSAELSGSAFEIQPPGVKDQLVPDQGFAQWNWEVTPKKRGVHFLQVVVSVRLAVPGQPVEYRSVPVLDQPIQVEANIGYWFGQNWPQVMSAIGGTTTIGGVVALIRKKIKRPQEA